MAFLKVKTIVNILGFTKYMRHKPSISWLVLQAIWVTLAPGCFHIWSKKYLRCLCFQKLTKTCRKMPISERNWSNFVKAEAEKLGLPYRSVGPMQRGPAKKVRFFFNYRHSMLPKIGSLFGRNSLKTMEIAHIKTKGAQQITFK